MEEVLNCFGNIVGTTSDSVSDSGLYITDLEAIETIKALIDDPTYFDDETSIENKLLSARRIAILRFQADVSTLMNRYVKQRESFSGVIASSRFIKFVSETGKSGIRVLCRPLKDAEIVLRGVNTIFSQTGSFDLKIASNYSDTIYTVAAIETTAGKVKVNEFANPISLPLYEKNSDRLVEYYIYHENDLVPADNKIQCSTCVVFSFDSDNPRFSNHGHKQYVNVAGFNGEPDDLGRYGVNYGKGLQLLMDVKCKSDRNICNEEINYSLDPLAMSYATAIQYKAGSVIVWDLISNPKLNRVLMGDMERFKESASYYERKYNDMVKYISKHIKVKSDCFCEQGFTSAKISHP